MLNTPLYFQSYTQNALAEKLIAFSESYPSKNFTPAQFERRALRWAKQMFQWFYQKQTYQWDLMSDLPALLREWAKEHLPILRLETSTCSLSVDGTHKFLWLLHDKKTVESVMIPATKPQVKSFAEGMRFKGHHLKETHPEINRKTACISSQVGCAMKCSFCLTGTQGIVRNLSTAEIVAQICEIQHLYSLTNIVFMGMGEPLNNLENVIKACEILLDQDGFNFSKRKITISTSGLVPKIDELGKRLDVSLAISLNATTDLVRSQIMPVNQKWNIQELLTACKRYPTGSHRRITFEYVLLENINDSLEDAHRLAHLVKNIPHKVNLIPFNPHHGAEFKRPHDEVINAFKEVLLEKGISTTVRVSRGQDILAACGQLRSAQAI
jgi:23S rRNA (adenine2503-C2)-methyltransferase